jgi:signal transduction histidine kinase/ABC-type uncharacterized transport system substrate-binding protein
VKIIGCLALFLFLAMPCAATAAQKPNILYLNSYHPGYKWSDDIIRGIQDGFERAGIPVHLHIESMDTKRCAEDEYFSQLCDLYAYKYSNVKFEIIISSDDSAFEFLKANRDKLFPGTPVVFCGVNYFDPESIKGYTQFTGVNEAVDIRLTLETALKIHPGTKKIYYISDDTNTGRKIKDKLSEAIPSFANRLEFISLCDMEMAQILDAVSKLPGDSLILYALFFKDKAGAFFEYDESMSMIAAKASVPIYGVWDFNLGYGMVGGMLTSGYYQGKEAAKIARRILKGENADSIPVVMKSPNKFMFDYTQLEKLGIRSSQLPAKSIIINQPHSFYEEHKRLFVAILAVILIQGLVIVLLVHNKRLLCAEQKKSRMLQKRMECILGATNTCLDIIDMNYNVRYVDPKWAEKYGPYEGRKCYDYFYDEPSPCKSCIVVDYIEKLGCMVAETELPKEDNRPVQVTSMLYVDENDEKLIAQAHIDISQRLLIEKELHRYQEKLEDKVKTRTAELAEANEHLLKEITDRKMVENLLSLEREQLLSIFDSINEVIYVSDPETYELLFINEAFKQNWGDGTGKKCYSVLYNGAEPCEFCTNKHIFGENTGNSFIWEVQNHTNHRWYKCMDKGIQWPDGRLVRCEIAFDITEQKKLETELLNARKLESIGTLAAGIAHEINTPIQFIGDNVRFLSDSARAMLNLINDFSDLLTYQLKKGSINVEQQAQQIREEVDLEFLESEIPLAIEQTLDGVERVSRIVNAMKDFSHMGSFVKVKEDLNKAVQTTATISRNEWKYVADLKLELDENLPLVNCMIGEIKQIVLNLIINAAHAIRDNHFGAENKGLITVKTSKEGKDAMISIADTGVGIPEEIRDKIFDQFFTTKKVGEGTGQGLAIAYSIVKKHEGKISFISEVGKGTTFFIRIPIE